MSTNLPATTWRATDGLSDFSNESANYIIDTTNFYLVDTTGFYIVDTGVIDTRIPATVWSENDGV